MSETPSNFAFPHRTPVFTTIIVLACFALFGWLARKYYVPRSQWVEQPEGVKTPAERRQLLAEHRAREHEELTTYGWIDRKAGVVRLPIDRAIELTIQEHAKK